MDKDKQTKILGESLKYTICMEYLGIHIIDSGENKQYRKKTGNEREDRISSLFDGMFGPETVMWYKFSVPKSSTLEIKDSLVKEIVEDRSYSSSDDLIELAKYLFREKLAKVGFEQDEKWMYEDLPSWEDFIKDKIKLYAKVREDDIWDNDKADETVKKILSDMKKLSGYKEV